MIGLLSKGHFSPGADGDLTVIDPDRGKATLGIVAGKTIMRDGQAIGTAGTLLVTSDGENAARESGLDYQIVDLTQSKLYANYKD